MVFETKPVRITELAKETEQYLLQKGCKKSTLGVYKATWHKFMAFSSSDVYSRTAAEDFLKLYFGVDVHSAIQKLDSRMRHALRHMNALEDYLNTGAVPRKRMRGHYSTVPGLYEMFFGDYLRFCAQQYYSDSWFSTTRSALRLFLLAVNRHGIRNTTEINQETIGLYSDLLFGNNELCQNTKRHHSKCVSIYLRWLFEHGKISENFSCLLPDIKRTPSPLPDVWEEADVQKLLDVIDTASPIGKRNYAIFLLLARTGLRISDVILLRFENIDWRKNCIRITQYKTGKPLSIPLSAEIGEAIIAYLKYGRPSSEESAIFLSHNAPFQPLNHHNNFNSEIRKYMRLAGIDFTAKRHSGVHTLRSSFATNILKQGASLDNISQILGHSDVNVATSYPPLRLRREVRKWNLVRTKNTYGTPLMRFAKRYCGMKQGTTLTSWHGEEAGRSAFRNFRLRSWSSFRFVMITLPRIGRLTFSAISSRSPATSWQKRLHPCQQRSATLSCFHISLK